MKTYQEKLENQENVQIALLWTLLIAISMFYGAMKLPIWQQETITNNRIIYILPPPTNEVENNSAQKVFIKQPRLKEATGPAAPKRKSTESGGAESSFKKSNPYKVPNAKLPSSNDNNKGYSPNPKAFLPDYGVQRGDGKIYGLDNFYLSREPLFSDRSGEVGKIVFKITVDQYGHIENIKTMNTTMTKGITELYKNDIRRGAQFSPKLQEGKSVGEYSVGYLTITVKLNGVSSTLY